MINEIIFMKGYGLYVWAAFSFTLISFATLYLVIKKDLVKEREKFTAKFGALSSDKAIVAKTQKINKEILAASSLSKI